MHDQSAAAAVGRSPMIAALLLAGCGLAVALALPGAWSLLALPFVAAGAWAFCGGPLPRGGQGR